MIKKMEKSIFFFTKVIASQAVEALGKACAVKAGISCEQAMGILRREKSFCKIFREVFRSFCEVFQSFRKFFEVFASFSRLSDPFGPIGMHSDAFGSNWKRLDVFEKF